MDLDFDNMTLLTGIAVLVALGGVGMVIWAQFQLSLVEAAQGLAGSGSVQISADTRERLAELRQLRLRGGFVTALGAAIYAFDVLGGTLWVKEKLL